LGDRLSAASTLGGREKSRREQVDFVVVWDDCLARLVRCTATHLLMNHLAGRRDRMGKLRDPTAMPH
jgi:hypothetical protein